MKIISTTQAPQAIGPYSQAMIVDGMLYTSGQIGLTPDGNLIGEGIEEQTDQVLKNLSAVVAEAGGSLDDVIKTTIFLADMDDFAAVNKIYAKYFGNHKPARSTVAVRTLPLGVKVEIECIAKPSNYSY
ncbi:MAG TPA: RidA family protein [Sulfurovum sp.]|nr:RidA family protein [Sulfurovum sp.]